MDVTQLKLIARIKDGKPIYEVVPAKPLGKDRFEILSSPGFAPGFARGDVVRTAPDEDLGYVVEKRGGYFCVQAFFKTYAAQDFPEIKHLVEKGGGLLEGGLDSAAGKLLIIAFPSRVGFDAIKAVMDGIGKRYLLSEWFYGNVYDTKDGKTPLNWWLKP